MLFFNLKIIVLFCYIEQKIYLRIKNSTTKKIKILNYSFNFSLLLLIMLNDSKTQPYREKIKTFYQIQNKNESRFLWPLC